LTAAATFMQVMAVDKKVLDGHTLYAQEHWARAVG